METEGVKSVIFDDIKSFCRNRSSCKALYINLNKLDEKFRTFVYKNELDNMFASLTKDGDAKTFFMRNDDFLVIFFFQLVVSS